jgi:uncharacterized protein with GYD domain
MSTVHFVGGEKGGVGKSVVARLLAQRFIDRSLPFAAFDADLSHGALVRYYSNFAEPVDLTDLGSADQIMDKVLTGTPNVVVDLPAQSQRALRAWIQSTDVVAYARESGVRLVSWYVTDGGYDSVSQLEQELAQHGSDFEFVVVKNEGRTKSFRQLDASAAHRRLLELGGRVITLPELDSAVMYEIDRAGSSFWAAINNAGPDALSPMARRRAKLWLERIAAVLGQLPYWQPSDAVDGAGSVSRQAEPEASGEFISIN